MNAFRWVLSLARRRPARILGPAAGVALAVALLGSIGAFLTSAKADMTRQALARVAVDWQVEAQPGSDPAAVLAGVQHAAHVREALTVGFADAAGLEATVGGTTQTTGSATVLGLPASYRATFPGVLRTLAGHDDGVLLAQQTAANLHAGPGDTVVVARFGQKAVALRVDGVVDLPQADSLFQKVGAPPGAQPQAPPDNVILLPFATWQAFVAPLETTRPDLVHLQVHARLDSALPNDPAAAFTQTIGEAHRVEADLAGAALVGDNRAAALDAARADALYAQVLFIVLGLPGAALAGLLTRAVAAASRDRRRREYALVRTRGASLAALQRLALAEAAVVAALGAVTGLALAVVAGGAVFATNALGTTTQSSLVSSAIAAAAGALIAVATVAIPARRDAASVSVATSRQTTEPSRTPLPLRIGLDAITLVAAVLVLWATSRGHYKLVLAPEGVPTVSVNYWALAGPLLLWAGSGLLAWRITDATLRTRRSGVRRALRPLTGTLAGPASSVLRRQRRVIADAVALLVLTIAFVVSTSVFYATYEHQAEVDAILTNGAPVTVTEPPGSRNGTADLAQLAHTAGVRRVEPVLHRYVYVGADLQDLYGVNAATITDAGQLQDAYFQGGSARDLMATLARQPDAALFSAETVLDFQLHPGDQLNLRIRDAASGRLIDVPFHYVGVATEFPTAPSDSFVVANASYLAARTGNPSPDVLLVQPTGTTPHALAARLQRALGTRAKVSDIEESRRVIGSSLTAVDLGGLTKIELGYSLVIAAAATGLVLALGFAERRRSLAIISVLGARPGQLAAFTRAEAAALGVIGGALGAAAGWELARVLVKVLTGVFDPAPSALAVPWGYLSAVAALTIAGLLASAHLAARMARSPKASALRDL